MSLAIRTSESLNSFLADGIQTVWPFSFSYLDPSHVKALVVDALGNQTAVPITSVVGSQATISPPVSLNCEVTIYRATPTVAPMVDFTDKAMLSEASLDLNAKQAVYAAADARDWATLVSIYSNAQTALAAAQNALASQVASAASAAQVVQSNLVHIAGAETVAGAKTFNDATFSGNLSLIGATNVAFGQVRLTKAGVNIQLSRCDGQYLTIGGKVQLVPAAGVLLGGSALAANTLYYFYAYMNAGVMTLEASTTPHASDATTGGIRVKSADGSRTLVGMGRTTAGISWADTPQQRLVLSYFNRRNIAASSVEVSLSMPANTFVERTTANRAEFLAWGDEAVIVGNSGRMVDTGAAVTMQVSPLLDTSIAGSVQIGTTAGATYVMPFGASFPSAVSEGYHYASTAASSPGTSTTITATNYATTRG